jgi:nucleoid-associated protein YgaU
MVNGIRNALLFGGGALVAALAVAYGSGAFAPTPVEKVAQTAEPTENSTATEPAGNSKTAEQAGNSMTAKEGRVPATPQKPAGTAPDKAAAPTSQAEADKPASKGEAGSEAATAAGNIAPSDNAASASKGEAEAKASKAKDAAGAKDVTAPSFDVVRVEGNGSIVVAGRSAPGAKVEILSGKSVLGTSAAGSEGDFAIALDDPLKPGDYQLVLRSTAPANIVAMSKETAVVSIPEHRNGQVLALVEAPGQPSKLITVPKPENAEAPAPAAPAAAPSGTAESAGANPPAATGPSGGAAAPPAATTGSNAGTGQETAAAGTKPSGQAVGSAKAPAGQAEGTQSAATAPKPQVSVEAVEIEGNKIFVAGVADPGSTVRVYANETVLGEAKTSPVGRFLVESIHELAVGDYIIRADMLGPDGLKVAARAAVPFTRAPGESVAAVASGEAGSAKSGSGAAGAPAAGPAGSGKVAAGEAGNEAAGNTANSTAPAASVPPSSGMAEGDGASQAVASQAHGSTVLPPLGNAISREPPTVLSPKLEETSGAVIIRRGDTLWQISRRVYGHGVRYSTIYLANQDQIENPDLIWPGQIFAVPNETKEGDTADMKAIAGQATEMPKKATE